MTTQPTALRLSDALEKDKWHVSAVTLQESADELRRLYAENEGRAERIAALYKQIEHEEELNSKLMAERTATMQRIVDKQTGYVRSKTQGGAQ